MISLAEAQARMFALASPVSIETVPLSDAAGRWAASNISALRTQPSRDLSAMDGYAISGDNLGGPWTVVGESAAGRPYVHRLGTSEAIRIFTGAVLPEGADTVIIQENANRDGTQLSLANSANADFGRHVRRAGSDFHADDVLITSGELITAPRIALAAMGGHAAIPVRRPLRIALISTGDELVPPGDECTEGQIPSSNAPMIEAMLRELPVLCADHGIIPDHLECLVEVFRGAADADIIVSFGGASVGDHDLVAPALQKSGAEMDFHKIAMRPGKPVMAGKLGTAVVLGLPGNPVSAFVTALLLLKPLILHLSGAADPLPRRISATLGTNLPKNGERIDHLRGVLIDGLAYPVGANDSSLLQALSASNLLIMRPANDLARTKGETVPCLLIDDC